MSCQKLFFLAVASLGMLLDAALCTNPFQQLEFSNVGFTGSYLPVARIQDPTGDSCTCELGDRQYFSGPNAPLNEYLSVHFRGPLRLLQFGFYTSDNFVINDNTSSSSWNRDAYYGASNQTTQNVTFLTTAGEESPCLGPALSYASQNGTGYAEASTVLESDNYIYSDQMYSIFSSTQCPSSGRNKRCGVYRRGVPAYYGFYGITKMFLFEFQMPTETRRNGSSFNYYDLPAIWLLDDHIPRISQFPNNPNCSCWTSGCGEFDIFEAMNGTERNNLYTTFHTFQGIENLNVGIQSYGYIPRDTENTMRGGVIFDSNGHTVSFLTDSLSFAQNLTASDVNGLLYVPEENNVLSSALATVSGSAPSSRQSSGFSLIAGGQGLWYYIFSVFIALAHFLVV